MRYCIPLGEGRPLRLDYTLDSGQVFRWRREEDGGWYGTIRGSGLALRQEGAHLLIESEGDPIAEGEVARFLGLDDPLPEIRAYLSRDSVLARAFTGAYGLRLVHQDPWEGLIAFICSSHNAVFRIQQMMACLSERLGCRLRVAGRTVHTFPPAQAIAALDLADLAACRLGYRDAYVLEAARMVDRGEVDPYALVDAPVAEARASLMTVPGVGPKVSDCILLLALGKKECTFPIDVWVRRAVLKHYRDDVRRATGVELATEEQGLTSRQYAAILVWARQAFAPYVGYAQTYLFLATREGMI